MPKSHAIGLDRHKLSDLDLDNRKALCSVCGATNLYFKSNRPRCATRSACEQMGLGYYIGLSDIEQLIGSKPVVCAVCQVHTKIVVDHDHNTNKVRGWLCSKCNIALGYLQDDPDTVKRLYEYIVSLKDKDKNKKGDS